MFDPSSEIVMFGRDGTVIASSNSQPSDGKSNTFITQAVKKGKTLSEAIHIMSFMKKERHIDADLFDLFLQSGIYVEYAKRYLKPEQIDGIDTEAYLG